MTSSDEEADHPAAGVRAADPGDRELYYQSIAQARFIIRRVFRLIEAQARLCGLEAMPHQALIQIYGSPGHELQTKQMADRLDISQTFASALGRQLCEQGYIRRLKGQADGRTTTFRIDTRGVDVLDRIDQAVRGEIDDFTRDLNPVHRREALSILMLYAGF